MHAPCTPARASSKPPGSWSLELGASNLIRSARPARLQLALSLEPVVEVLTVGSPAPQVTLIRGLGDLVVARVVLHVSAVARRGAGHLRGRIRGCGSLHR